MKNAAIRLAVLSLLGLNGAAGCSPKHPPKALYAGYKSLSGAIAQRLDESFDPVPNTKRVGLETRWSKGAGGSRTYGDYQQEFRTIAFVLDLRDLDLAALRTRMRQMGERELDRFPDRNTWKDVAEGAKRDSAILHTLSRAIALNYADRLSGLGLEKTSHDVWANNGEGCLVKLELFDAQRANLVTIGVWIMVGSATAQVDVSYYARWGDRDPLPPGQAPPWGSRTGN